MSNTRIVYTRPDGGISVIAYEVRGDETEETVLQRVLSKDIPPDATNVRVMSKAEVETAFGDRWFRNAWRCTNDSLHIPMDAAREAHRERIRTSRKLNWNSLDIEQIQALGKGDTAKNQEIEAKKQVWRDAPSDPRIDAATTLEELRAVWPADLPLPPV